MLTKRKPVSNCLLVTQFHGTQRNASCNCRFDRIQLDGICGSKSLTRATLICTPYCKASCVQSWINSSVNVSGRNKRISLARERAAVIAVLISRGTPQIFCMSSSLVLCSPVSATISGTAITACIRRPPSARLLACAPVCFAGQALSGISRQASKARSAPREDRAHGGSKPRGDQAAVKNLGRQKPRFPPLPPHPLPPRSHPCPTSPP